MNARNFFSDDEKKRIVDAIVKAEAETSGEIRVHISEHCKEGALNAAAFWFEKLEMHKTERRNGALFFLAVKDREFAVIGDAGINSRVPADFWDGVRRTMSARFQENLFAEGLTEGIAMAGEALKQYFPLEGENKNELPDEISYG
ncbi:MAG: TPM domain-containing protein [Dysgonamonadaceae bacterium]|nr:TPM domain-containing protein [Dysgonamonadaceae bacterium]